MRLSQEADLLLSRYLTDFARKLPFGSREEITRELRSSVLDSLEAAHGEQEISEAQMTEALRELGAPGLLAASYAEKNFVISPDMFPLFRLVFLIAASVTGAVSLIGMVFRLISGEIGQALLQIPQLAVSLAASLGFITAIFYIIERFNPDTDWKQELFEDWSPKDLPEIGIRKPVSRAEQILSIIFSVILIVGLTIFGERIGVRYSTGDACVFIPMLKEEFFSLLPILIIRWSLTVVLAVILLIQMEERLKTSIFILFLNFTDIAIAGLFLQRGPSRFIDFSALETSALEALVPILRVLFIAILVLVIILTVYEIIKKIIELVRYPAVSGRRA